jgi:hypothetical protein
MAGESDSSVDLRLRAAVESAPSGLLMVDQGGHIVLVNREVERLFGYAREELLGHSVDMLVPERLRAEHAGFRAEFAEAPRARAMGAGRDLFGLCKDGREIPVEIGLTPVATNEGLFILSSIVDISARQTAEVERRRLERQLRQAQKMEAVGTLAGGIAHDFNNILGAIIGYGELLETSLVTDRALVDLQDLLEQAKRGRALVERLLAFSRQQEAVRAPVALDALVEETRRLLRATLPSTIELSVRSAPNLPRILADAPAVQQIILNLSNNAAHAMPNGGLLEIRVEPLYLRDSQARAHPELREGPHVLLAVADTGVGMPTSIRERAFEPFFTTKPAGEGSGLGLSMVHGIMQEHEGALELHSELGVGTIVRCLFPVLADSSVTPAAEVGDMPRGDGLSVLYVDDEPALAHVGRRRLESLGYRVTALTDGAEAVQAFRAEPAGYDVVITDYSMPGLNGVDLSRAIQEIRPGTPVILLTGFVDDSRAEAARLAGIRRMAQKPLTFRELAEVVAGATRETRSGV